MQTYGSGSFGVKRFSDPGRFLILDVCRREAADMGDDRDDTGETRRYKILIQNIQVYFSPYLERLDHFFY